MSKRAGSWGSGLQSIAVSNEIAGVQEKIVKCASVHHGINVPECKVFFLHWELFLLHARKKSCFKIVGNKL